MLKVFICYSRKDTRWIRGLPERGGEQALIPWLRDKLERRGIQIWWDDELHKLTGEAYDAEIGSAIDSSDTAVLLLSDDFFISDYIAEKELPRIRARVERGEMRLFPIVVGYVDWAQNDDSLWLKSRQIHPSAISPLIEVIDFPAQWSKVRSNLSIALREQVLSFSSKGSALSSFVSGDQRQITEEGGSLGQFKVAAENERAKIAWLAESERTRVRNKPDHLPSKASGVTSTLESRRFNSLEGIRSVIYSDALIHASTDQVILLGDWAKSTKNPKRWKLGEEGTRFHPANIVSVEIELNKPKKVFGVVISNAKPGCRVVIELRKTPTETIFVGSPVVQKEAAHAVVFGLSKYLEQSYSFKV